MLLSVKICSADRKVRKLLPLNPTDIAGFFELSVKSLVLILTKKIRIKFFTPLVLKEVVLDLLTPKLELNFNTKLE